MTKCASCSIEGLFEYRVTSQFSLFYCSKHMPKFLNSAAYAGRLVKHSPAVIAVVEEAPKVEETPKPSKKKYSAPVVEEPVIEETPVVEEPAVVEEVPAVEETAPSEE